MVKEDTFWHVGEVIILISCSVLILSVLLPWQAIGFSEIRGFNVYSGIIVAIISIIIFILLLLKKYIKWISIIGGIFSLLLTMLLFSNLFQIINRYNQKIGNNPFGGLLQPSIGIGLYLAILSSLTLIVGAFLIKKKNYKK